MRCRWLGRVLLAVHEGSGTSEAHKPGMVVHACNINTHEVGAGRPEVQGHMSSTVNLMLAWDTWYFDSSLLKAVNIAYLTACMCQIMLVLSVGFYFGVFEKRVKRQKLGYLGSVCVLPHMLGFGNLKNISILRTWKISINLHVFSDTWKIFFYCCHCLFVWRQDFSLYL